MIFICEDQFFAQSDILSDRHFEKSYCTTCDCAGVRMQRQLATGIVVLCVFNMARLRLVGRPGRRFGNKGLRYADGDRSSANRRDGRKGCLVVSVHRGLRDFVAIAGGDSDDEVRRHRFSRIYVAPL